jgi:hypothetical protein
MTIGSPAEREQLAELRAFRGELTFAIRRAALAAAAARPRPRAGSPNSFWTIFVLLQRTLNGGFRGGSGRAPDDRHLAGVAPFRSLSGSPSGAFRPTETGSLPEVESTTRRQLSGHSRPARTKVCAIPTPAR